MKKTLQILLDPSTNLSANQIAHILKTIGEGSMQEGVRRTFKLALKDGIICGGVGGLFVGVGLTIIILALCQLRNNGFVREILAEGLAKYGGSDEDLDAMFSSLKEAFDAKAEANDGSADAFCEELTAQTTTASPDQEKVDFVEEGGEFDADEAWSEEGPAAEGI